MGASRVPDKKDFDWGQYDVFDKDVSNTFTKEGYFNNYEGTYGGGEGAIVAFVARKIYKNGGYFCATQIQAANENWNDHSWIDYYRNSFPCETVCKPGFYGDECEKTVPSTDDEKCKNDDFTEDVFRPSLLDLLKKDGGSAGRFTEEMQVLDYEHGYGTSDYNHNAWDTLLGVLEVKKHGILVAPVKVQGRRTGMWPGYRSYMINAYATKNSFLLCAAGYVKQGDDCVMSATCKQEQQDAENDELKFAEGYDYFDPDQHEIKIRGTGSNKYKIYRCKKTNYGFESETNHNCTPCGETKKSGLSNDGVCRKCETGKLFDENADGFCKLAKRITKDKMRACFMKTDPDEFKTCVNN